MPLIFLGSVDAASDATMATVTNQANSRFRAALVTLIEAVLAGNQAVIDAAEQAAAAAVAAELSSTLGLAKCVYHDGVAWSWDTGGATPVELVPGSNLEGDLPWSFDTSQAVALSTSQFHSGTRSLYAGPFTSHRLLYLKGAPRTVNPGDQIALSAWVRPASGYAATGAALRVVDVDRGNAIVGSLSLAGTPASAWTQVTRVVTIPAGVHRVSLQIAAVAAEQGIWLDDLQGVRSVPSGGALATHYVLPDHLGVLTARPTPFPTPSATAPGLDW